MGLECPLCHSNDIYVWVEGWVPGIVDVDDNIAPVLDPDLSAFIGIPDYPEAQCMACSNVDELVKFITEEE